MATTRTITNAWKNRYLPDIFYEEPGQVEDGVLQESPLRRIINLLWERYEDRPDVFMSGMVFISYDVTDGNARVAPDFFIAFDVPNATIRQNLPNFLVWKIGKVPDFVMEVASPSTAAHDLGSKRELYAELGAVEYWRFDPTGGELYGQPLAGERLVDGEYQPYELQVADDGSFKAYSEVLDVEFYWDGHEFDVLDPKTGRTIDKFEAEREARLEAEAQADMEREARLAEREARLAAEARERELLNELNRLRSQLDR